MLEKQLVSWWNFDRSLWLPQYYQGLGVFDYCLNKKELCGKIKRMVHKRLNLESLCFCNVDDNAMKKAVRYWKKKRFYKLCVFSLGSDYQILICFLWFQLIRIKGLKNIFCLSDSIYAGPTGIDPKEVMSHSEQLTTDFYNGSQHTNRVIHLHVKHLTKI